MWALKNQIFKALLINDLISDYITDSFSFNSFKTNSETSHEEYIMLNEFTPPSHINTHIL